MVLEEFQKITIRNLQTDGRKDGQTNIEQNEIRKAQLSHHFDPDLSIVE